MAIMVDYAEVLAFQGRLGDIYRQIDSELAELSTRVEELTRVWEGAAAEGFWDTVREWQASATDLRERLAQRCEALLGTAVNRATTEAVERQKAAAGAQE